MPSWIEFHDSTVTAVTQSATTREVLLDAYVHRWELHGDRWRGTGWIQPVRVRMQIAADPLPILDLPTAIADGELRSKDVTRGELLPLPFDSTDDFVLSLRLVDGRLVEIAGRGLQADAFGDGRFVEDLPEELRPRRGPSL